MTGGGDGVGDGETEELEELEAGLVTVATPKNTKFPLAVGTPVAFLAAAAASIVFAKFVIPAFVTPPLLVAAVTTVSSAFFISKVNVTVDPARRAATGGVATLVHVTPVL